MKTIRTSQVESIRVARGFRAVASFFLLTLSSLSTAAVVTWEASGTLSSVDTSGGLITEFPAATVGTPFKLTLVFDSSSSVSSTTSGSAGTRYRYTNAIVFVELRVAGVALGRAQQGFAAIDIWDDYTPLGSMESPADGFNLIWGVAPSQAGGFAQLSLVLRGPESLDVFSGPGLPDQPSPLLTTLSTHIVQLLDGSDSIVGNVDSVTIASASADGDQDGDGKSDILWRNDSTGQNALWTMDGGTLLANIAVPTVGDTKWQVVGRGDYNGDDTADILWRKVDPGQPGDGAMAIWLMQGGERIANLALPPVSNQDWQVVSDSDYNGDNEADVLWRNVVNGQNALWQINGGTLTDNVSVPAVINLDWAIVGDGDYTGDGKADILWRNTSTGAMALWPMNGAVRLANEAVPPVPDSNWQVKGDNDYDGDGKSDVLWRNVVTGDNALWLMDGSMLMTNLAVLKVSNIDWQVIGDGDYSGDKMADILWRNMTSGENAVWVMNVATRSSNEAVPSVPLGDWGVVNTD